MGLREVASGNQSCGLLKGECVWIGTVVTELAVGRMTVERNILISFKSAF